MKVCIAEKPSVAREIAEKLNVGRIRRFAESEAFAKICAAQQVLRELPQRRFLAEYRSRSCLIGKTVELTKDDGTVKKVAVLEIADDCGLVVRDSFGNVETLHAGEVHIGAKGLQR